MLAIKNITHSSYTSNEPINLLKFLNYCTVLKFFSKLINQILMSSHQVQIESMLFRLQDWNKQLGGNLSQKINGSEFDFLQEEFLTKRHQVEKAQDVREKEGYTSKNAGIGIEIREGLGRMKELAEKLRAEYRRLVKKKKDPPEILEKKLKIVQNCQLLLQDLQERQTEGMPKNKYKAVTLTEMKAKLLQQIDEKNQQIHEKRDSDGKLTDNMEEDRAQIAKWKKKDQQMDAAIDDIIVGIRGIKGKVKNINEAQEVINEKTGKAGNKVDSLTTRIKGDNQKLKKIIEDFKPNRCCLYVALFLLLIGLIVVVVKILI